jgi:2-phospho-L-lactate guanylyltransferase (CobY/MobA/RfbA family)
MATTAPHRRLTRRAEELPRFDLDFDLDTPDDPTEVTIYSSQRAELATHWISIDVDHAVDLRDVA